MCHMQGVVVRVRKMQPGEIKTHPLVSLRSDAQLTSQTSPPRMLTMPRTFAYILVIILLNSGFAAAADFSNEIVTFHSNASLVSSHSAAVPLTALHHNDSEHHAHHGCHMSAHMVALISGTPSIKSVTGICEPSYQNPIIITRRSAPPTRPPRA